MVLHLPKGKRKIAVVAGVIGNIMEWYDFALYGFMAQIISQLFFPEGNQTANLLATYGIFAAGFIMRPIGSIVFGWMGDTIGRSKTMLISVSLMTIPTFVLGLLPSYAVIGIWAPVGLIIIRLLQGLSVGGEFSSSVTYLVETAPEGERGLSDSWANVGSMTGMLLGSGMAGLVMMVFDDPFLKQFGWRIPFIFAAVLGIGAMILRRNLPKSEHFEHHEKTHGKTSPVIEAITVNLRETCQAALFASGYGAVFYISLVYIPTWLGEYSQASKDLAMNFNTIATALVIILAPVAGWLSDKYMRRTRLLAVVFFLEAVLAVPLFLWMNMTGSVLSVIVSQLLLGGLIAFPCGIAPAVFVELFPTEDRLSGYSIAFNLGIGVIGGSTPMMSTWLISKTGMSVSPGIYISIWALLAVTALLWMKDRSREPLRK
jgi:MHS family proline/betaine transporter-like MFS transporter